MSKTAMALAAALGATSAAAPATADPSPLPVPLIGNYGETETTRSAAMGGALRALANGTSGVFLNPSALVETQLYHIEALVQLMPEAARQAYGATVVDSVTSRLAGSLSVIGGYADPGGIDRSWIDARAALGFPLTERLFVGIGGRYYRAVQNGFGPLGSTPVSGGGVSDPTSSQARGAVVNTGTFDASLTLKPSDSLYIAAVGQNLTYPNVGLLPTMIGGGVGFGNETLSIEADGLADLNSWGKPTARAMAGGEFLAAGHVPLRLGYRYDQGANKHFLSGGAGYVGQEFSIEGSVRRSLSNPGQTIIVLSVAYFFESSGLTHARSSDLD